MAAGEFSISGGDGWLAFIKIMNEPLDRNKTDLTRFVTACSIGYLADKGFKPIETEVAVAQGWITDVASFCYPTQTEIKKIKLKSPRISIDSDFYEICFMYGHLLTALIEIKTTRADFIARKKIIIENKDLLLAEDRLFKRIYQYRKEVIMSNRIGVHICDSSTVGKCGICGKQNYNGLTGGRVGTELFR
jgi:hypothetical protein